MVETAIVLKLKLNPDEETSQKLDGQSKIANWVYNHLLEKANALKQEYIKSPTEEISKTLYTKRGLRNQLPKVKEENPFVKTVHSSPLKNSALRLSDAIQRHQKTKKSKQKKFAGWPKFRSWKARWFSLLYDEPGKGFSVKDNKLHLSLGMGKERKQKSIIIPINESRKLNGRNIRTLRIVKQAGVFSAIFTVTKELPERKTDCLGSCFFSSNSFYDLNEFIKKITDGKRPIDKYFKKQLQTQLKNLSLSEKKLAICDELNIILETNNFYQKSRLFSKIQLSKTTEKLISSDASQLSLIMLKRKLLEDAYPDEIVICQNIIAFDPNHKNLAYGVDINGKAIEVAAPTWLKTYDKRIDELKAKRDRCKKRSRLVDVLDDDGKPTGKQRWQRSRRWNKYHHTLEKVLAKRRDQTKTYLFTLANMIYSIYTFVVVGDYTPHGGGLSTPMRRAMNNRSLIGRFKHVLSWVALRSGKSYDSFNERGTTRTCSQCQHKVEGGIPPNVRLWTCSKCSCEHIRDENAAINGLSKYLRVLEKNGEFSLSVPCSGLVPVKERWAWRVQTRGVASAILRGADCGSTTSEK